MNGLVKFMKNQIKLFTSLNVCGMFMVLLEMAFISQNLISGHALRTSVFMVNIGRLEKSKIYTNSTYYLSIGKLRLKYLFRS